MSKNKIIGCIPLEKRQLKSKSKSIICYFITIVLSIKLSKYFDRQSFIKSNIKKNKISILSFESFQTIRPHRGIKKINFII